MNNKHPAVKITKEAKDTTFVDCDINGAMDIKGAKTKFIRSRVGKFTKEHPIVFVITMLGIIIGIIIGVISLGQFVGFLPESLKNNPQISIVDVQYELQDEKGSIIRRKSWQDNSILDSDSRNIYKMLVSIKLRNSSNKQVFSKIENYEEIFSNPYVVKNTGEFFDKKYSIPTNGDSGFIFAIDITPFTKVNPLSLPSSKENQDIKFYDKEGVYIDTGKINTADIYGITIPYKLGIYSDKGKLVDIFNFNVLCRAQISNLNAALGDQDDHMYLSKSLNFECLPAL